MLYEDLRFIHEDVERLEQAIADRNLEDPQLTRTRLNRDHEVAFFIARIQEQSQRALKIYKEMQDERVKEIQSISTGDTLGEFYKQFGEVKEFHKRNPQQAVENLETLYRRPEKGGAAAGFAGDMDGMFTGEEDFGRFFDLTLLHEEYLNLKGIRGVQRVSYTQYLDIFDVFTPPQCPLSQKDKLSDGYFSYVSSLATYMESFMRKARPLEELDKLFASFNDEFEKQWAAGEVSGWEYTPAMASNGITTEGSGEGIWCADCEKEFKNEAVYKAHLTGKKHMRAAEAKKSSNGVTPDLKAPGLDRLKERAVAEREHRVRKLAGAMKTVRSDTRANIERKQGMTEREREEEIAKQYAEEETAAKQKDDEQEDDDDEKIYNPLKLPLAWDGKPIPFWLYKLHGLGTEYSCEICGNFTYMGRRAYEKHFSEARHLGGLRCLGITNTALFREITTIKDAMTLNAKLQEDKKKKAEQDKDIVEMEDSSGTVMPWKVWNDLKSEGLL